MFGWVGRAEGMEGQACMRLPFFFWLAGKAMLRTKSHSGSI